jgi:hypothetical protein
MAQILILAPPSKHFFESAGNLAEHRLKRSDETIHLPTPTGVAIHHFGNPPSINLHLPYTSAHVTEATHQP